MYIEGLAYYNDILYRPVVPKTSFLYFRPKCILLKKKNCFAYGLNTK